LRNVHLIYIYTYNVLCFQEENSRLILSEVTNTFTFQCIYTKTLFMRLRHWFFFYTHKHTLFLRNSHCSATETWLCHLN